MDEPINITLNRKVRPLRLAFLIDPPSRVQLMKAIQINTILWGGRFNPLIPVYRRTPRFWEERPFTPPKAKDIVTGYLRAFDPDFVVNMTDQPILPEGYEGDGYKKRVLFAFGIVQ